MNKIDSLWKYIQQEKRKIIVLSFAKINDILGIPIDYSFLNFKKELKDYGYAVEKISIKDEVITFLKTDGDGH